MRAHRDEDCVVKIAVKDIKPSPTEIHFVEGVQELNDLVTRGGDGDYRFAAPMQVALCHFRSGDDLWFSGTLRSELVGQCGRCLEEYPLPLHREFSLMLSPNRDLEREQELTADELSASFYNEEEVDLSALVHEETLLALPSRPLCRDDCRGLCSQCGINLNVESCECRPVWKDPRLAVLSNLRLPPQR
ncbi:MAG: DUF177 domain-containing protein [Deltaproteobacteria bacterium]|nr:DUF177 domain-containing protein [Deltaproteobacteria bacterium]